MGDDVLSHLVVPETTVRQVLDEVLAAYLELAGQNSTRVDVAGERLETPVGKG
jgi:hypothetical protein